MSASGSSKSCPHCGAVLFDEMPYCRTCGWRLLPPDAAPAADAPASEFIPYGGPDDPESWLPEPPALTTPVQLTYPLPPQPSYPPPPTWQPAAPAVYPYQGINGLAGYAPTPTTPLPTRRSKALLWIALAIVLLVGVSGGVFLALQSTSRPAPVLDRHGLQSNVPLPENSAFQYKHTVTQGNLTADEWIWKVNKSEPATIQQFYRESLPKNGWTHVQSLTGNETLGVVGCQDEQIVVIGISKHLQDSNGSGTPTTTDAPTGGSALGIALTDNDALRQNFCTSAQP